ncbi:MAG TPA: PIG-L family deacetylase [Methylomirabilota bacterium]|nr:PIG-L family deacetylase [Methylomirabilota bacterium]
MNPYEQLVAAYGRILEDGKAYQLGGFTPLPRPTLKPDAPKALIFSPHPDDEVIIGALPLRLMREAGMRVINVAVTQGSNRARQAERWQELTACCEHIGFGLIQTREGGLEGINPKSRTAHPTQWQESVRRIAEILAAERPHSIFFPHDRDWNSTHIGTHHLVVDALKQLGPAFSCYTLETEFWGAMDDPNLMVECSAHDLADLLTALSFHVGEVRRNPYHVRTPAWMIDNVRRGCELVGGQGGAAPNFAFGTLYRLRRWQDVGFQPILARGRFLAKEEPADRVFAV